VINGLRTVTGGTDLPAAYLESTFVRRYQQRICRMFYEAIILLNSWNVYSNNGAYPAIPNKLTARAAADSVQRLLGGLAIST
jgi:hypothetical protein